MGELTEKDLKDSMRSVLKEGLEPIEKRLDKFDSRMGTIEKKLFIGNGEPPLIVQQAETRAKLESYIDQQTERKRFSIRPPKTPDGFWKMVGIVLVAAITAFSGYMSMRSYGTQGSSDTHQQSPSAR